MRRVRPRCAPANAAKAFGINEKHWQRCAAVANGQEDGLTRDVGAGSVADNAASNFKCILVASAQKRYVRESGAARVKVSTDTRRGRCGDAPRPRIVDLPVLVGPTAATMPKRPLCALKTASPSSASEMRPVGSAGLRRSGTACNPR